MHTRPCLLACTLVLAACCSHAWAQSGLVIGSFAGLEEAIKAAENRTLTIDSPQAVKRDLTIPATVQLVFTDREQLVKDRSAKSVRVTIRAAVTAPLRAIFRGFEPGEILIPPGRTTDVSPQWWGAEANSTADDTLALQCALNSHATTVFLPAGRYRVTTPLDLTHRIHGLHVKGESMGETGSILVGETGGVVLDATGSLYLHLHDFAIAAGPKTPSTVGILFDRSTKVTIVGFHCLDRVRVNLPSIPQSNGGNGTVGIYNRGAEVSSASRIDVTADNPLVFTASNVFDIRSSYTESIRGIQSMTDVSVDGTSMLRAGKYAAVTLENASMIQLANIYIFIAGKIPDRFPYAVKVIGTVERLHMTGMVEGYHQVLYSTGSMVDCRVCTRIPTEQGPLVCLDGSGNHRPGMVGCTVDILPPSFLPQIASHPLVQLTGKGKGIQNSTFYLHRGQTLDVGDQPFVGNVVHTLTNEPPLKASSNGSPRSYFWMAPQGSQAKGTANQQDVLPREK